MVDNSNFFYFPLIIHVYYDIYWQPVKLLAIEKSEIKSHIKHWTKVTMHFLLKLSSFIMFSVNDTPKTHVLVYD